MIFGFLGVYFFFLSGDSIGLNWISKGNALMLDCLFMTTPFFFFLCHFCLLLLTSVVMSLMVGMFICACLFDCVVYRIYISVCRSHKNMISFFLFFFQWMFSGTESVRYKIYSRNSHKTQTKQNYVYTLRVWFYFHLDSLCHPFIFIFDSIHFRFVSLFGLAYWTELTQIAHTHTHFPKLIETENKSTH